jgi:alkanesulfonate monooxygenase
MNTVAHQSHGMWTHPRDRSRHYNQIGYWLDLARTLERGRFDGLFLADVLGVYDVYQGSPDAALRNGMQIPVGDPMLLIPAMATVTEHLGFGVTGTLSFEPPYPFARRMSTLDHLTNGRIAWNVVTGYLNSAAQGMGLSKQETHDRRYDSADEYMEVVYRLWEGSWEDDAVQADKTTRVFTDPAKVHRVRFDGAYYSVDAIHLCEPSPQRTPVLFQAGASARGRAFAARHAECVFINGTSKPVAASFVADLRERTVEQGRRADDVRIFNMATVIVGRDEAEARAKLADYRSHVSHESALAVLSGWSGIDLGKYGLDEALRYEKTEAIQSFMDIFRAGDTQKFWTMRSAAAARSSSARPRRWPTGSRPGSTRRGSTASTSPTS